MKALPSVLAVALAASACGTANTEEDPALRGAIVYLVDTLRADHLSCYGYERETSPGIDAFASTGIRFDHCLSQSTWTKPSTASVLTGLYPAQHGANKEGSSILVAVDTLAERLVENDIKTAGFYANNWLHPKNGLNQGFETWEFVDRDVEARTREVVDRGLAFLDSLEDERFFLYLHVVDPHAPYDPPPPYDKRFGADYQGTIDGHYALEDRSLSLVDLPEEDLQHLVDLYDGEIAFTDSEFARFLAQVEARGLSEETLVVFTADHGEEFGEHGGWRHNPQMFDEVVRVPLIVRRPGAPAGLVHDGLAQQIDIAPTVLSAFGLPADEDLPGRDLVLRALTGDELVFGLSEVDSGGWYRKGVVAGKRKYLRAWAPTKSEQLYDLATDPDETTNLLTSDPTLADAHRDYLDRFLSETNQGFFLLFQNGSEELIKVEVLLFADVDFLHTTALYTEDMAGGGEERDWINEASEVEWRGRMRKGSRYVLRVAPGDGDGVKFVPVDEEETVLVEVRIDGEPIDGGRLLLGASGEPAGAMPYELATADSAELESNMFPAREVFDETPYRVRLWSGRNASGSVEFSEEEILDFKKLGYFGEEE